jgi:hypothetical protein
MIMEGWWHSELVRGSRCGDGGASGRVGLRMRKSVTGADEGGRVIPCAAVLSRRHGCPLYIIIEKRNNEIGQNIMNNTILKVTLSSIANFKLQAMQHGQNIKEHVDIESKVNKNIKTFSLGKKQVLCMDLLPLSSVPASLVTMFFVDGAKIPATVSLKSPPPYMSSSHPLIASMSPLSRFFFLLPYPTFIRSGSDT